MQTLNDRNAYGWVTIALHWLAAVGVLMMLWTGFNAGWAEDAGDKARNMQFMGVHIAIGAAFYIIWALRIGSHYVQSAPLEPVQSPPLRFAARAVHNLLLLMIAVQMISGPLFIWSRARPVNAGFISIPSPFAVRNDQIHELADMMHTVGRWALVVLITLHVLAALKHLIVDRNGLFTRILVPGRQLKSASPPSA
jgi:cytochrome b561